jgi:hypothetical protein
MVDLVAYGADNDKVYDTSLDLWLGWDSHGEGENGYRISRDRPGVGQIGDHIYVVGKYLHFYYLYNKTLLTYGFQ